MELRHFRCFLAVARSLHFSRAAAELGISPPALSKQIQETERFLGARLFLRTKRSVALTAAGEVFLGEAQRAMQQIGQAQEAARRAGRGELGAGGGRVCGFSRVRRGVAGTDSGVS